MSTERTKVLETLPGAPTATDESAVNPTTDSARVAPVRSVSHTPGPWQMHSEYEDDLVIGDIDGPDNGEMTYAAVCTIDGTDPKEGAANARLICAAPDLLAQLKSAVSHLAGIHSETIEGEEIESREEFPGTWNEIDKMRAVIAKATGAQQ